VQAGREVDLRLHMLPVLPSAAGAQQGSAQHHCGGLPVHRRLADAASLSAAGQGLPSNGARGGGAGHFGDEEPEQGHRHTQVQGRKGAEARLDEGARCGRESAHHNPGASGLLPQRVRPGVDILAAGRAGPHEALQLHGAGGGGQQ